MQPHLEAQTTISMLGRGAGGLTEALGWPLGWALPLQGGTEGPLPPTHTKAKAWSWEEVGSSCQGTCDLHDRQATGVSSQVLFL